MFYDSIVIISKCEYLDFISFARQRNLQRQLFQSSVNDQTIAVTETVQHKCPINRQRNLESFQYNALSFHRFFCHEFLLGSPISVRPFWLPFHTLHYIRRRTKKKRVVLRHAIIDIAFPPGGNKTPFILSENPSRIRSFATVADRSAKAKTGRFGSINRPLDSQWFIGGR